MEKPLPGGPPPAASPTADNTPALDQNGNVIRKGDQIAVALTGLLGGFIMDINESGVVIAIPLFADINKPIGGLLKAHQRRYDQPPNKA